MIFRWLYDSILHMLLPAAFSHVLYSRLRHKKYKLSFQQRCGINYPSIDKKGRYLAWIHAVSVGETKAVAPLVKKLKSHISDLCVVISNVTETGHAEAKRCLPDADYHVFLPFDLPYIIRPIIQKAQPDIVILSESDFWYNFQDSAKESGAKLVLVNGKLSEKSLRRYRTVPWFSGQLFYKFDLICCQNDSYKGRFMQLGIPPDQLTVTGNLKLDDQYPLLGPNEVLQWKETLGISSNDPVLVVGSTHDPEEKIMVRTLRKVWKTHPNLKVLLVPRKPERFNSVASLLSNESIPFALYSKKEKAGEDRKVILVDAMGILRQCYQLANIAIVAGSFTPKVGGHNLLEPAWYGVPVIHGPHVFSQRDMADQLRQYQAGVQANEENLPDVIIELLEDKERRRALGDAGKLLFAESSGATLRTWDSLSKIIMAP